MSTMTMSARLAALPRAHQVRLALKLDAVVAGVNGAAYLVAAAPLEDLLGLSPALLRGVGAFLVAFAAGVWVAATRAELSRSALAAILGANALWAVGSIAFVALDAGSPTTVGEVWIVLQALVVAGFAGLQVLANRSSS